jgi:hypothetical protein
VTAVVRERGIWSCRFRIETFEGEWAPGAEPIAVVETDNMLMHIGVSYLWECALGRGGAGDLAYLTAAAIGVGDGTAVAAATQTNLQGLTRFRKGMDTGYPEHTHGSAAANRTITLRTTLGTGEANFDHQEVGCFTSATDGSGTMLNRKVQAIGVKSNTVSRVITATVSID